MCSMFFGVVNSTLLTAGEARSVISSGLWDVSRSAGGGSREYLGVSADITSDGRLLIRSGRGLYIRTSRIRKAKSFDGKVIFFRTDSGSTYAFTRAV